MIIRYPVRNSGIDFGEVKVNPWIQISIGGFELCPYEEN
jgi:hypothetical protein